MEVTGTIKEIQDTQQITDKFKKRGVVVTTQEQYPQHILVDFVQDKTEILNQYAVGDDVKIGINIRGNEWTKDGVTKYFNSIQGWRIEKVEQSTSTPPVSNENTHISGDEEDDLPF